MITRYLGLDDLLTIAAEVFGTEEDLPALRCDLDRAAVLSGWCGQWEPLFAGVRIVRVRVGAGLGRLGGILPEELIRDHSKSRKQGNRQ